MTQGDADYYQAGKDQIEAWGEAQPAPKSRRRRLVAIISVRFTPDEEQAVRRAAREAAGTSVSHFIRQAALLASRRGHHARASQWLPIRASATHGSGVQVMYSRGERSWTS